LVGSEGFDFHVTIADVDDCGWGLHVGAEDVLGAVGILPVLDAA
jgi:hypothetical protein